MCRKFTPDELNTMDHESKNDVIYQMQERLDRPEHDYENLMEQVRLADRQRFGRNTEKPDEIAGQLSFFNEAEANCDENVPEPTIEETAASVMKPPRKHKKKGQREEDLKDFPQEEFFHDVPIEELDDAFGRGNWKSMPDGTFWQLRFEPARWIAEKHVVKVYVGTDGLHQDEFLRGDHPAALFKGSIATPSLEAAVINAKYVNSSPLDRIARDFQANGLNLSKQTMSNWTVWPAERYFLPLYEWMKKRQPEAHVNQCDETPSEVIHDGRPAGSKSYMWVHLTGELSPVPKMIIYEYQKTRHSSHPKEYYKDFTGVLMTDGLEQYHKLERDLEGVTNANCMAHAGRHFANAIKAVGRGNQKAVRSSVAYKALVRIGAIYDLEKALKDLTAEERFKERQASVKPLAEEFSAWIRETLADFVLSDFKKMDEEKTKIVNSWKKAIHGKFIVDRHLRKGSVLISVDNNEVYIVKGIYSSWREILENFPMPQIMETTLMPFKDVIIHDGIVAPYGVCLGKNMSEQSKQIYLSAKANGNLHYNL